MRFAIRILNIATTTIGSISNVAAGHLRSSTVLDIKEERNADSINEGEVVKAILNMNEPHKERSLQDDSTEMYSLKMKQAPTLETYEKKMNTLEAGSGKDEGPTYEIILKDPIESTTQSVTGSTIESTPTETLPNTNIGVRIVGGSPSANGEFPYFGTFLP